MTSFRSKIKYACRVGRIPTPPAGATHVLVFQPPYMHLDGEDRIWELMTTAFYAAAACCSGDWTEVPDGPDPRPHLGAWAAAQVGHPVRLIPAEHLLKPPGLARPRREAVYWVVPA